MSKRYVVYGEALDYEHTEHWEIACSSSRERAEAYAKELNDSTAALQAYIDEQNNKIDHAALERAGEQWYHHEININQYPYRRPEQEYLEPAQLKAWEGAPVHLDPNFTTSAGPTEYKVVEVLELDDENIAEAMAGINGYIAGLMDHQPSNDAGLAQAAPVLRFFKTCWGMWCDGCWPDGFDAQEMMLEGGVTRQEAYDPDQHDTIDAEPGEEVYLLRPEIAALLEDVQLEGDEV